MMTLFEFIVLVAFGRERHNVCDVELLTRFAIGNGAILFFNAYKFLMSLPSFFSFTTNLHGLYPF